MNHLSAIQLKLGRAIKVARVKKGWKQSDLAKRLDVTTTYISLLECDKRDPSWSFVNRLADTLGVPLPLLLLLAVEGDESGVSDIRSAIELLALIAAASPL